MSHRGSARPMVGLSLLGSLLLLLAATLGTAGVSAKTTPHHHKPHPTVSASPSPSPAATPTPTRTPAPRRARLVAVRTRPPARPSRPVSAVPVQPTVREPAPAAPAPAPVAPPPVAPAPAAAAPAPAAPLTGGPAASRTPANPPPAPAEDPAIDTSADLPIGGLVVPAVAVVVTLLIVAGFVARRWLSRNLDARWPT